MELSDDRIFQAIKYASREVFEKTLFMDLFEHSKKRNLNLENSYHWVGKIKFEGDHTGFIYLFCSIQIIKNIVVDFLGIEDTCDEISLKDGFNEITNMVAGNILSGLADEGLAFKQGLPKTRSFKGFNADSISDSLKFCMEFSFDEENIAVQVIMN